MELKKKILTRIFWIPAEVYPAAGGTGMTNEGLISAGKCSADVRDSMTKLNQQEIYKKCASAP
ncbi:MAG: hypothetical protein NT009_11560 [Proteobacteria bacterium]|nr:hypothetical protein [Pseudomonadota bacterium]